MCVATFLPYGKLFAQKEVSKWYFGRMGLDFACNPPAPISPSRLFSALEASSVISDSLGNLLFYTDGHTVYDHTHKVMSNGAGLASGNCYSSSTQGVLIVKQPGRDSLYYVFTTDCAENHLADGFRYSVVNMNHNGGKGAVVLKNQKLLDKVCEKLAAVRHANGTDVWILTHEWGNNKFCAYLLTASGLSSPVNSHSGRVQLPLPGGPPVDPESAARGYMKFSLQGDRLVVVSTSDGHRFVSFPELFQFNANSGQITYQYSIQTDSIRYFGASFSPDGNLLYLSSGWYGKYIHQFDVSSDSVFASGSKYVVHQGDINGPPSEMIGALQLGPDGKIYNPSASLNVISNPNGGGAACGFQRNVFTLECGMHTEVGLPNMEESLYRQTFTGIACTPGEGADFTGSGACKNTPVIFRNTSDLFPFAISNHLWDFGDPASGNLNISYQKDPEHIYTAAGSYLVKLIVRSDTLLQCQADTITKTVLIGNCNASLEEVEKDNSLVTLYPNPAKNQLTIKGDIVFTDARMLDAGGKPVYTLRQSGGITSMDFDLKNGFYVLILSNGEKTVHKKLLINR